MSKPNKAPTTKFLRWSEHVPTSDVQDPLGLGLRGSTRLASRLLFCITSITPRARYFSFLPWCVQDWQERERGQPTDLGWLNAVALREKALTLGCIAHHEGKPCIGGALVGSDNVAKWYSKGEPDVDLRKLPFAKNPALGAYFNSLVNLGFFVTDDELAVSDELEEETSLAVEDLQLSDLGKDLAQKYGSNIARLECVKSVSARKPRCTVRSLRELGKRGGLCELSEPIAPERELLRDIFFARVSAKGESHAIRSRSLELILELCRQLDLHGWNLNEPVFASAVYFGEVVYENARAQIEWPRPLIDIAIRWRMFYFHHYMSVALEGLFAWLVTEVSDRGLAGVSLATLSETLNVKSVQKTLAEVLSRPVKPKFGKTTFLDLLKPAVGGLQNLDPAVSRTIDQSIRPTNGLSEERLEELIRGRTHLRSPVGLAVPMILLAITLARYVQWESTNYGNWLASASTDAYLDLVPPVLTAGLDRRFGDWWKRPWQDLAEFVLSRYVVQQHQAMSYEKTAKGDRCLLQLDDDKVMTPPHQVFEKIGMGNPRFRSAVRILMDLGVLVEVDGLIKVTKDGKRLLDEQIRSQGVA